MKTIEDVAKYAREKRMPERGIDDMVQRLGREYPDGHIDDMLYHMLCAEIDRRAEYWEGMRRFLEKRREERAGRKK